MSQPGPTRESRVPSFDKIQTVGQLKEWLKGFPDHHTILGAIPGEPRVNWISCRHAKGHVIIEVPRRLEE